MNEVPNNSEFQAASSENTFVENPEQPLYEPTQNSPVPPKGPSPFIRFIRIFLLILIVIGVVLLSTQIFWIPSLDSWILGTQNQNSSNDVTVHHSSATATSTTSNAATSTTQSVTLIPPPTFSANSSHVQVEKITDSYDPTTPADGDPCSYDITIEYPQITDLGTASERATINAALEEQGKGDLAAIQKDFKSSTTTLQNRSEACGIDGDDWTGRNIYGGIYIPQNLSNIISLQFGFSEDTGGAHPNGGSFVQSYDLSTGNLVQLTDVFNSSSNYLGALSNYSLTALPLLASKDNYKSYDDQTMITAGLDPSKANFSNFYVTDSGIGIRFSEYQIGPYSEGQPPDIIVPYSFIKTILNTSGPVGKFAQ